MRALAALLLLLPACGWVAGDPGAEAAGGDLLSQALAGPEAWLAGGGLGAVGLLLLLLLRVARAARRGPSRAQGDVARLEEAVAAQGRRIARLELLLMEAGARRPAA